MSDNESTFCSSLHVHVHATSLPRPPLALPPPTPPPPPFGPFCNRFLQLQLQFLPRTHRRSVDNATDELFSSPHVHGKVSEALRKGQIGLGWRSLTCIHESLLKQGIQLRTHNTLEVTNLDTTSSKQIGMKGSEPLLVMNNLKAWSEQEHSNNVLGA